MALLPCPMCGFTYSRACPECFGVHRVTMEVPDKPREPVCDSDGKPVTVLGFPLVIDENVPAGAVSFGPPVELPMRFAFQRDPNAPAPLAATVPTADEMRAARKAKPNHPFAKAELYEKCPACQGTQKTKFPAMVDRMGTADGKTYTGPLPVGSPCPLCAGETPGFIKVGMTTDQLDRKCTEHDSLLTLVVELSEVKANGTGSIDVPNESFALSYLVGEARAVVAKVNHSDVSQAREAVRAKYEKVTKPKPS